MIEIILALLGLSIVWGLILFFVLLMLARRAE